MTLIIYLLLYLTIIFSLIGYGASNVSKVSILKLNSIEVVNPFIVSSYNKTDYWNLSKVTIDLQKRKNFESKYSTSEVEYKLKKYNSQLSRNLKTLNYIFLLELDSDFIKDSKRSVDILNLKESLQREVIRNTKLICNCKAQMS